MAAASWCSPPVNQGSRHAALDRRPVGCLRLDQPRSATVGLRAGIPHRRSPSPMAQSDRFLLAGVMGWPVMHSRSPKLHNYWLGQHGLTGAYLPLAIKAEGLAAALRALAPLGFSGCNLTIPHKE